MRDFLLSAWDVLLKLGGAAAGLFSPRPEGLTALCVLMAADYLTGVLTGFFGKSAKSPTGRLSARASFMGLLRKGLILLVVLIAALADRYTGGTGMLQNMTVGFYLCNEGISVLENLALLGVPVPPVLKNALDALPKEKNRKSNQKS